MEPESLLYRATVLILTSLSACPNMFVYFQYIVLQPVIAKSPNCSDYVSPSVKCCADCLGVGDDSYNLAFGIFYLSSTLSLLLGGWLVDKFGNWFIIVFSIISQISYLLIAVAGSLQGSAFMQPLLYAGFFVFGCGYSQIFVAKDRIIGVWFNGKELHLAFGLSACMNRMATFPSFMLTELIREAVGLQLTLWLCPVIATVSVVSSICLIVIDAKGNKRLGITEQLKQEQKNLGMFDLLRAGSEFWLLVAVFGSSCSANYVLNGNTVEFLHEYFSFRKQDAAVFAGFVGYVGVLGYPIFGFVIDKVGRPGLFLIYGNLVMLAAFGLLLINNLHPVIALVLIGCGYSVINPAVLGSIPLVLDRSLLGSGSSTARCIESALCMVFHTAVAAVLGRGSSVAGSSTKVRWIHAMGIVIFLSVTAIAFAFALVVTSCVHGSSISRSNKTSDIAADYKQIDGTDSVDGNGQSCEITDNDEKQKIKR